MAFSADKALRQARNHIKKGNHREAEELYKLILDKFPSNKSAQVELRKLRPREGAGDNAIPKPSQEDIQALIGLFNQGQFRELLDTIAPVVKLYPQDLVLLNIQGAANSAIGYHDAAIKCYQKAINLAPDNAQNYNNLGNVLAEKGELEKALTNYDKAIALNPYYAEALHNAGNLQSNRGAFKKAINHYQQAIKNKPDYFESHLNLAIALTASGALEEALISYDKAIQLDPQKPQLFNDMGVILAEKGDHEAAVASFRRALAIDPDHAEALANIGSVLSGRVFNKPDAEVLNIILKLLGGQNLVNPSSIVGTAISLLRFDPYFNSALNLPIDDPASAPLKEIIVNLCQAPVLLSLMAVCPLSDLTLEKRLEALRAALLFQNSALSEIDNSSEILEFQIALALQCFTNEYLYEETDKEASALQELSKEVERKLSSGEQPKTFEILCLASYRILGQYPWAHLLSLPASLEAIERRLLLEFATERALKSQIPVLGDISDDISSAVGNQYEEHPYPRWVNISLAPVPKTAEAILRKINSGSSVSEFSQIKVPQILIAGCGTGQQSIQTTSKFKECDVVAIDLSLSSLAYAKRKTEELGFTNIKYKRADILNLRLLNQKFDIIECGGVLHHMNYPMDGWKALNDSLKPGGFMKIGLYSRLARKHIASIREEIRQEAVGNSQKDMKKFRQKIINTEKTHYKQITRSPDFYSMSMLRDLLFHEQEHYFDLPQIKDCLSQLGLLFYGFDDHRVVHNFQSSSHYNNTLYDLDSWNAFEKENPATFAAMYQFWCKKSG